MRTEERPPPVKSRQAVDQRDDDKNETQTRHTDIAERVGIRQFTTVRYAHKLRDSGLVDACDNASAIKVDWTQRARAGRDKEPRS